MRRFSRISNPSSGRYRNVKMERRNKKHLACFISAHGFGHAARVTAVLERLLEKDDAFHFHLFTTVPSWFFEFPLSECFSYHETITDVGFVQRSPFLEDLDETESLLDAFLPFDPSRVEVLAATLRDLDCLTVLCDISPLGIAAAKRADIPSVLVENFTWDWLYAGYPGFSKKIRHHIDYLSRWFDAADYRIQTEPICAPKNGCVTLSPISRKPRSHRKTVRQRLEVPGDTLLVLITLGGIPDAVPVFHRLKDAEGIRFVIPGGNHAPQRLDNLWLLPHESDFYHPDLVHAADAVIGKAGYSTIAEVYSAGVPFGFIPRPGFPESLILTRFIQNRMAGRMIQMDAFYAGDWIRGLEEWIGSVEKMHSRPSGAPDAARFLYNMLDA